MKHLRFVSALLLVGTLVLAQGAVKAQGRPDAGTNTAPATLKVTVVLSRSNGEKKISNLPFVLLVTADERPTTVQMSSSIPIPTVSEGKSGYSYQQIGTNMSASAKAMDGGQYVVNLTVTDSQMLTDANTPAPGRVQNFTSSPRLVLHDGSTIQYAAATDKMTGDVVKVDVVLNVIK